MGGAVGQGVSLLNLLGLWQVALRVDPENCQGICGLPNALVVVVVVAGRDEV